MSSVSSSDSGNRQDEVNRRNREDYTKKESELIKKQQREIRRMSESHYQEVERLKKAHAAQLEEVKKHSNDTISERDHRYQKEVEDLRNMHRKQLEQTSVENQRREESYRKATKGDIEGQRLRSDTRFEKLNQDYNEKLRAIDETYRANAEEGREIQARSIEANREKLLKQQERELAAVKKDRDERVSSLQNRYDTHRENSEGRLKDQKVQHMRDQQRASDNLMRAVTKEREDRRSSEGVLRDGFQDGLETMRERFETQAQKNRAESKNAHDFTKETVNNRVDGQVRRLEGEKESLKDLNVRRELELKREKEREVQNVQRAYQKNIDNYKMQRDEAVAQFNERNRKDVENVRDELSQQMVDSNRFFRGRMHDQDRIHRVALDNMKGDFEARTQATSDTANQRVMKVLEETNEEKARMVKHQQEMHAANQRLKADELKALHDKMADDKEKAVNALKDRMRNQELQHAERLNQVVSKYEKQVQALKDDIVRQKKLGDEFHKKSMEEMQRQHQMAMDQLEAKNRDRLRQVNQQHSTEIRVTNQRHEERLDQVIGELKKT